MNKGTKFELLISQIEKALHDLPGVTVSHNVRLKDKSGTDRQIDILITDKRERFTYTTIIECKNTKARVDINTVGSFRDLIKQVNAHQGIIVASSGFQSGAIQTAKDSNILLYEYAQSAELGNYLKNTLITIYNLQHRSTQFSVNFHKKTPINQALTIYDKLFSPTLNRTVSLVDITEEALSLARPRILEGLKSQIVNPHQNQLIQAGTDIKVQFPQPLLFEKNGEKTLVTGFDTTLITDFTTSPTEIKNVSGYKDIKQSSTHAIVIEVEFCGEVFRLLQKPGNEWNGDSGL